MITVKAAGQLQAVAGAPFGSLRGLRDVRLGIGHHVKLACCCGITRGRSSFEERGRGGGRGGGRASRPVSNPLGWSSGTAGAGDEADKAVDDWFRSS